MIPSTGPISASAINAELGRPANATLSMNDPLVRTLAAAPTGGYSFDSFRNKFLANTLGDPTFIVSAIPILRPTIDGGLLQSMQVIRNVVSGLYAVRMDFNSAAPSQWGGNYSVFNLTDGVGIQLFRTSNLTWSQTFGIGVTPPAILRTSFTDCFTIVHS